MAGAGVAGAQGLAHAHSGHVKGRLLGGRRGWLQQPVASPRTAACLTIAAHTVTLPGLEAAPLPRPCPVHQRLGGPGVGRPLLRGRWGVRAHTAATGVPHGGPWATWPLTSNWGHVNVPAGGSHCGRVVHCVRAGGEQGVEGLVGRVEAVDIVEHDGGAGHVTGVQARMARHAPAPLPRAHTGPSQAPGPGPVTRVQQQVCAWDKYSV